MRRRRPSTAAAALAVAIVAGLAAGCSSTPADGASATTSSAATSATTATSTAGRDTGTSATTPGPTTPTTARTAGLAWAPCGGGVQCATLAVPLDPERPDDGRTIDLAVTRKPATGTRIGSLFVNPGGPGGSGNDFLRTFSLPGVTERFDLVSWDPRGVGDSRPLGCDGAATDRFRHVDSEPDDGAEQTTLDDAAREVADACATAAAELLPHLRTTDTVADIDRIREAMGDDQLSYIGFSYGTDIGQAYAERHPDRVRAMVLDGVVDPSLGLAGLLAGQTDAIQASLDRLFDACTPAAGCPLTDPRATFDRVAARVERDPLPAGSGPPVGPSELALAAIASSYQPTLGPRFLSALAAADAGTGSGIASLARTYTGAASFGAYLGVSCTDGPHPDAAGFRDLAADLAQRSPRIGAAIANELLPCAWWGAPAGPPRSMVRAEGTPPILVLGNTGDAATPYAWSVKVAEGLADGHLVTYQGEGHTSLMRSTCVAQLVGAYLVDLTVPPAGATCPR
ncbi:MAG: alpha/beta hydrolase [Acidimicrobiales bacterium]